MKALSNKLNKFIIDWYEQNKSKFIFTNIDDFNENDIEGTLKMHIERYNKTGYIHIWTGSSDNTIFGKNHINWKFRAWHDYIHIINNLGYDFIGESHVCEIQKSMLPIKWYYEKQLIQSEIVGQALYFMKHNEFLKDQVKFTIEYLSNPNKAIINKQ